MNTIIPMSRRNLIKLGTMGFLGLASGELLFPNQSFASEIHSELSKVAYPGPVPAIRISLSDDTGAAPIQSLEVPLLQSANVKQDSKSTFARVKAFECRTVDDTSVYSLDILLRDADEYVEESEENDDQSAVRAIVTIGANWGANQSTIQIVTGQFEIIQTNPLVTYSNTWYALMQKTHSIQQNYNGSRTQVNPGWGPDSVDLESDKWTCGGATGGMWTDLLTGQVSYFTVELYLV